MSETSDYCWVSSDGAIQSGTERELMAAYLSGRLPEQHPIWHADWGDWLPLADALSRRLLEAAETLGPISTERRPMTFEDPKTPVVRWSAPTLPAFDVEKYLHEKYLDADSTLEELTVPRGLAAIPLTKAKPPTPRSEPEWIAPPAIVPLPTPTPTPSFMPTGIAHSVRPAPPGARSRSFAVVGLALAMFGAAVGMTVIGFAISSDSKFSAARRFPPLPRGAHRASGSAPITAAAACRPLGEAQTLAERVQLGTPIDLGALGSGRLGVGVVTTQKTGLGLEVSPASLKVESRATLADAVHVGGIVPLERRFATDRFATTVPATDAFDVGMTPFGFSRLNETGEPALIWGGEAAQVISRPRFAHARGSGWAVAFRRGSDSATIRLGWLDEQGKPRTELQTLSQASGVVDAPSVSASEHELVIAYAARQPADAPWSIELGHTKLGELVSATQRLPGGGGPDRRAPSVAALDADRFLVAWAEGNRDSGRTIRMTVLDSELVPIETTRVIARANDAIGATAAWRDGTHAVVLYTERAGRQTERLRAIALECR